MGCRAPWVRLCRGAGGSAGLGARRERRSAFAKHLARPHALPPHDSLGAAGPREAEPPARSQLQRPVLSHPGPTAPVMGRTKSSREDKTGVWAPACAGEGTMEPVRAAARASGALPSQWGGPAVATQAGAACLGLSILICKMSPAIHIEELGDREPSGEPGPVPPQLTCTGCGQLQIWRLPEEEQGWLQGVCSAGKHPWLPLTSSG